MSHWNHRVLAFKYKEETYLQIHEVYYDENGVPNGYTENAISIGGEDLEAIRWQLGMIQKCLDKPILNGDNFPEEFKL